MRSFMGITGFLVLCSGFVLSGGCSHVLLDEQKSATPDRMLVSATAQKKESKLKQSDSGHGKSRSLSRKQVIQAEGVARLPVFSSAIRSGDLIFLSGTLGTVPRITPPQLVAGGIIEETRQTMENIRSILAAAGASMDDLIKCTVFLADIKDYAAMNQVYAKFFAENPPARSALAGGGLALGAKVEIECIAAAPKD